MQKYQLLNIEVINIVYFESMYGLHFFLFKTKFNVQHYILLFIGLVILC